MNCKSAVRLVEKLADGEATPSERVDAEAHVEECEDCRAHYELVRSLESVSDAIDWPAPPEAYWQHLPSKVMARIESESKDARASWGRWLTPAVLRFGAVAAMVTVVVAVGVNVLRDDPGQLEPSVAQAPAPSAGELSSSERPAAADDARRAPQPDREQAPFADAPSPRVSLESVPAERSEPVDSAPESVRPPSPSVPAAPAPAEPAPAEAEEQLGWEASNAAGVDEGASVAAAPPAIARENRARRAIANAPGEAGTPDEAEQFQFAGEATLASDVTAGKEAAAVARASSADDACTTWRAYLTRYGDDGSESIEARYRVALCAIDEHEAAPSDESLNAVTVSVDAFLALESEGDRADELRRRRQELVR